MATDPNLVMGRYDPANTRIVNGRPFVRIPTTENADLFAYRGTNSGFGSLEEAQAADASSGGQWVPADTSSNSGVSPWKVVAGMAALGAGASLAAGAIGGGAGLGAVGGGSSAAAGSATALAPSAATIAGAGATSAGVGAGASAAAAGGSMLSSRLGQMLIGQAISSGVEVYGAYMASRAAHEAASQQQAATQQAMALQQQMYGDANQRLAPYVAAGQNAINQLNTWNQAAHPNLTATPASAMPTSMAQLAPRQGLLPPGGARPSSGALSGIATPRPNPLAAGQQPAAQYAPPTLGTLSQPWTPRVPTPQY